MSPKLHPSIIPLLLLCVLGASVVQSHAQTPAERFAQFDKNGDGRLTREEFPAAKIFDGADADKDGLLTREEVAAYFRKLQGGSPTTPPTPPTPAPAPASATKVEIVETLNVPYASVAGVDPNLLALDIHAPKDAKTAPVVMYVHGGYWKAGDKAQKGHLPEFFCQRGHVFVSVNYRLAPAVKHPVLIQDVARAVAWVHEHIAEHGGDAAQLFLTGHSAGAQLVALLGTDAKRLGEHGKPLSILRGVIPLDSAAMDLRDVTANVTNKPTLCLGGHGLFGTIGDYERLCLMILNRGELDGVRVLKPETVDLIFENHLKHPTMKYGLGGIVNGAGTYGWGGADGTQFVGDRSKRTFTLFMVQTQHYKAPTYPALLALANEACGPTAPGAMTGTAGGAGGMSSPFKQRDTNGDGKLSREELPAALFDQLDADKDGFVTEAELAALWKK